jgi:CheY-like chemotaxis protein
MPPAPILVVDDDSPNRSALCRVLVRDGWRTKEAMDGADAMQAMEKEIPSLILLDLVMPNMDGFDFISRLRENPKWQSVPILVLTAKDLSPSEKNRLSGHVEKVFQKGNYTRNELIEKIRSLTTVS